MTKLDCERIACVYAMADGCSIGNPRETCAYHGDGSCLEAVCRCCARENTDTCNKCDGCPEDYCGDPLCGITRRIPKKRKGEIIMQEKDKRVILREAIMLFGKESQTGVAMEECAELIQAISKARRGVFLDPSNPFANLIEEIADVRIMIAQLILIYNLSLEDIENEEAIKLLGLKDKIIELGGISYE